MDLSGQQVFRDARAVAEAGNRFQTGESLLAAAWSGLASARYEAVDIHLRTGQVISGAIDVRIDGRIGEACCRRDEWTHMFAVEEVVMVRRIQRGRKPL